MGSSFEEHGSGCRDLDSSIYEARHNVQNWRQDKINMKEVIRAYLCTSRDMLDHFISDECAINSIAAAADLLTSAFESSGRVFSCGNGGSMCDAMHFSEELTGRYRADRPPLPAVAISDVGHISCVSNDYGYENVFARYLEAHGRQSDVLLAITTSGRSPNVLRAIEMARLRGMKVIGLTGSSNGRFPSLCDVCIETPKSEYADHIQEIHLKVMHILIGLVEQRLFR